MRRKSIEHRPHIIWGECQGKNGLRPRISYLGYTRIILDSIQEVLAPQQQKSSFILKVEYLNQKQRRWKRKVEGKKYIYVYTVPKGMVFGQISDSVSYPASAITTQKEREHSSALCNSYYRTNRAISQPTKTPQNRSRFPYLVLFHFTRLIFSLFNLVYFLGFYFT